MSATAEATDLQAFRAETRAWLTANCPPEMREPVRTEEDVCWGGRNAQYQSPAQKLWLDRMAERGWTAPSWPSAYGGGGLSTAEAKVLREEMAALNCRPPLSSFGLWMLGPALLKFGTEVQKQEHLPSIVRGEIRWCQGYSEPNAGSDLASLATRAVREGDEFVVNGQKIWTSYANKADKIFCLVRTDTESKHSGISFLLFDMTQPGVRTQPILLISGKSPFCETFFDNVRVPVDNVVGEVNGGWTVAKYLLQHEREMIAGIGDRQGLVKTLAQSAAEQIGLDAQGKLADSVLRADIARFELDEAAFRNWTQQATVQMRAGTANPSLSSALKYYGAELNKRRLELLMSVGGGDLLEWESERSNEGFVARTWLRSKANSIEGGTAEVQLNVIAKRILELPGA